MPHEIIPFAPSTSQAFQEAKSPDFTLFPPAISSPPGLFCFNGPATVTINPPQT
jgi:hypothetical protein